METETDVLRKFAEEIAERISRKTISALQKVEVTLSADDSELENAWDEIAVQLQSVQSEYWDAYDETVRAFVLKYVQELGDHEKSALWFQTEQGLDWLSEDEEDRKKHAPVLEEDIVNYVVEYYIYKEAGDWTNKKIRAYLNM